MKGERKGREGKEGWDGMGGQSGKRKNGDKVCPRSPPSLSPFLSHPSLPIPSYPFPSLPLPFHPSLPPLFFLKKNLIHVLKLNKF